METVATSNDSGSMDAADLGCPSYSMEAEQQVEVFSFWVEGISQVSKQVMFIYWLVEIEIACEPVVDISRLLEGCKGLDYWLICRVRIQLKSVKAKKHNVGYILPLLAFISQLCAFRAAASHLHV